MPAPLPNRDLDAILEATAPLFSEIKNQRIFLTGGTGFFGTWLVESFLHINRSLSLNAAITVLTRNPDAFLTKLPHLAKNSALKLVQGDIRTFVFPPGRYRYIIHAATAASAALNATRPDVMRSTILEGTARTLDFAAAADTRKLLYLSSGAIYGPQPAALSHIPEDHPPHPTTSAYAQAKLAAEDLCIQSASPLREIKIARPFAFLGPHLALDAHFAAGNFLSDALARRPIRIVSDGSSLRSYLYPTDLCTWLWTILFRGQSLRPYNVGSEQPVSILQLAGAVRDLVEPSLAVEVATTPDPTTTPHRYIPSTLLARQQLNLRESVPLEDAIRRTARWHQIR